MTGPSAAHARLREATADDHARVDASFADGLRDAPTYQRYVRGMHALLNCLENSDTALAATYATPLALLADDLPALGLNAPTPPPPLTFTDNLARLGAGYVIEGSALGARLLLRQAQSRGHSSTQGATFLAYHVDRGYTHWPRLMQALAPLDPTSPEFQTVLHAAQQTFALAATCFDRMGLPAKDPDEGQNPD